VDLGCATRNVLTMEINLPKLSYGAASKRVSFYEQLLERTQHLPGVRAVGLATVLPGQGRRRDDVFTISEHPPLPKGQVLDALTRFIDPGFFTAMQIPLLQGRFLQPNEQLEHGQSVVISQALVNEYFPAEDPLGKHIKTNIGNGDQSFEIVGVVADTLAEVSGSPRPAIFYPLYLGSERSSVLAIRTKSSDPAAVALPVQQIISSLDHDLPVANVMTMDQIIGQSTLNASFDAKLLLAFAILSLTLAAAGLFGVLSYIVAQRTTEIGIRIALGAQREQVMRLMLRDGLRPALFGLVLGLVASAGVTRLIQSMLYGTHPLDPVVFIVVSAALLLVAALACAIPAWHASQLDPIQALRAE
jgi:predicted permease